MRKQKKERKAKQGPTVAQRLAAWYASWKATGYAGLKMYVGMVLVCAAAIGIVAGLREAERRVLGGQVVPLPQRVKLHFENLPDWMHDDLLRQIAWDLLPDGDQTSYSDPRLTADVCRRAQAHPWIARVERVTKQLADTQHPDARGRLARDGMVVIRAQYRQPVARVQAGDRQWVFVDREGVRLPDEVPTHQASVRQKDGQIKTRWFLPTSATPADAVPLHYVAIQGVDTPPPDVGQKWDADDLAAGLRLAGMLSRYAWHGRITTIDVRNHIARLDPYGSELRMFAKMEQGQTVILFGRFPLESGDWEISPDEKLDSLDIIVRKHNGLARGEIDLRYASPFVRTR